MPPTRTTPTVVKKTERTHEENQERAYIAASRRSDRSLEARVESARRASEIHKKRTGRSLRITEQDVINEEMYEEEDDDLPLHYRLLQHQLRTDSAEFNRRYLAYMTSQLSVRSALDQAYAKYFPNYDNVVNGGNESALYMNPLAAQPMRSPPVQVSPTSAGPYPLPRKTSSQSTVNASSSAADDDNEAILSPVMESQSSPSKPSSPAVGAAPGSKSTSGPPFFQYRAPFAWPQQDEQMASGLAARQEQQPQMHQSPYQSPYESPHPLSDKSEQASDTSPFTTALPPSTQQFLSFLDSSDSYSHTMLGNKHENDGLFSPQTNDNHTLFGDTVPVFPSAAMDDMQSPKGSLLKVESEDSDHIQMTSFDENVQDDNWNLFMNEWESVGGSQN